MNKKSIFFTFIIILLILGFSGCVSLFLIWTGPETVPEDSTRSAKIVQTIPLVPQTRSVAVGAQGSVIPSKKVVIKPQVTGQVIWQSESITIGGHVKAGDELIRIDPNDYELALAEVQADFEQARFEREVESGRQVIAKREWDELQADLDPLGRMARLVVSVTDPLKLSRETDSEFPLLLGSYVEAKIDAGQLENTLTIPRSALREGNQIWVVGDDRRLKILPATVLWPEKETVIISNNVDEGDQLVVSDLPVALPGMEVDPQPATAYPELVKGKSGGN